MQVTHPIRPDGRLDLDFGAVARAIEKLAVEAKGLREDGQALTKAVVEARTELYDMGWQNGGSVCGAIALVVGFGLGWFFKSKA